MKLHPSEEEYIIQHPYCLHLWRPQKQNIPQHPSIMVGYQKKIK